MKRTKNCEKILGNDDPIANCRGECRDVVKWETMGETLCLSTEEIKELCTSARFIEVHAVLFKQISLSTFDIRNTQSIGTNKR